MSKHLPNSSADTLYYRQYRRDGSCGGGGGDGDGVVVVMSGEKNHVLKSKSQPMSISFESYFFFYLVLFLFLFFIFIYIRKPLKIDVLYNSHGNITSTYMASPSPPRHH